MQLTEQNGLRILTPDDPDNWLTNGETYSQRVYLGSGDSVENWREIAPEERADQDIDPAEALARLEAIL